MMQEDQSQPFYGGTGEIRRYEPPQDVPDAPAVHDDYYTATSTMGQPLVQHEVPGVRKNNFPPCRPFVHHDINIDIRPEKRLFVRKAYVGYYFHCFCLLWNFSCLLGGIILGEVQIGGFFLGLASLILGPPISFCVYFLLYRAMRSASAFSFILWFVFFVGQLAAEVFYGIGLTSYGSAGFMMMVYAFNDGKIVLGVLGAVATFSWIGIFLFNLWLFYQARNEFKHLGGAKAATKEFAKKSVQAAYDNRATVKQVIVDNKDTIKQAVVDNKDVIIDFAKDHKEELINFASENKEVVGRVAMENQDTIWENRDVVSSVFDQPSNQRKY